jgi:subtilisin family serine protease/subtilisin-like proprotein convertase family protein
MRNKLPPKPTIDKNLSLPGAPSQYKLVHDERGVTIHDLREHGDGFFWYSYDQVEMLSFPSVGLSLLSLKHPTPFPADDIVDVGDLQQPTVIDVQTLLQNDVNFAGKPIAIDRVESNDCGKAELAYGQIIFNPYAGYDGICSFSYYPRSGKYINDAGAKVYLRNPMLHKDPYLFKQWHLWEIEALGTGYSGNGVKVLLTDMGLTPAHRDLEFTVLNDLYVMNGNEIGVHPINVASVIGAKANDVGIVGLAPTANISIITLENRLAETDLSVMKMYDIINNSWGQNHHKPTANHGALKQYKEEADFIQSAITSAAEEGRNGLGSIVIWASGNTRMRDASFDIFYNRQEIVVSGMQYADDIDPSKDQFKESTTGAIVLVSAPYNNIAVLSIDEIRLSKGQLVGRETIEFVSGTSFSAPIVSGTIALMLEANPQLGHRDVQEILALSATHPSKYGYQWQENHAAYVNHGHLPFNHEKGFGLVNTRGAVKLAETWQSQETAANEIVLSAILPIKRPLSLAPLSQSDGNTPPASADDFPAQLTATFSNSQNCFSFPKITSKAYVEFAKLSGIVTTNIINQLSVLLISPAGTRSLLFDGMNNKLLQMYAEESYERQLLSTHFRGEATQGIWQVCFAYGPLESHVNPESKTSKVYSLHLELYARATQKVHFLTNDILDSNPEQPITIAEGMTYLNLATLSFPAAYSAEPGEIVLKGIKYTIVGHLKTVIATDYDDELYLNSGMDVWPGRGNDLIVIAEHSESSTVHYHLPWSQIGRDKIVGFKLGLDHITSAYILQLEEIQSVTGICSPVFNSCETTVEGKNWSISLDQCLDDAQAFLNLLSYEPAN